jgi:type II secretory pathway predicted ATPase ExeA
VPNKSKLASQGLNEEQLAFCERLAEFCHEHKIGVRKLADICDGASNCLSKSTADRILHGTIKDPFYLDRLRPVMAQGLAHWLDESQGYAAPEIEELLSHIFEVKEFKSMLHNRSELHLPAQRHFGLSMDPFDVDMIPDVKDLYTTPELDALTQRVKDAVIFSRFMAVIGEVGTGKDMLLNRVRSELAEDPRYKVRLFFPQFFAMDEVNVGAIATYILREFDETPRQSKPDRVRQIKDLLTELYAEDTRVCLVFNECHRLNSKVISSLKNFWELDNGKFSRLIGVLLLGWPKFQTTIRDVSFKEIRQRIRIAEMPKTIQKVKEDTWDWTTGLGYVKHRLKLAGGNANDLFQPSALDKICQNAATPLELGNLVNEALLATYDKDEPKVTSSLPFFKKLNTGAAVLATRGSA